MRCGASSAEQRAPPRMEQSSIPRRRQQSLPHSCRDGQTARLESLKAYGLKSALPGCPESAGPPFFATATKGGPWIPEKTH